MTDFIQQKKKEFEEKFLPTAVIWVREKEGFSACFHLKPIIDFLETSLRQARLDALEEVKDAYQEVFERFIPIEKMDEANDLLVDLLEPINKMGKKLIKKLK